MTLARAALERVQDVSRLLRGFPQSEMSACERQARAFPDIEPVQHRETDDARRDLAKQIERAWQRGGAEDLPVTVFKRAPVTFWGGATSTARLPGLVRAYILQAQRRWHWAARLIDAWLIDFAPEAPEFEYAGGQLARLVVTSAHPRAAPWAEAQHTWQLFEARVSPGKVAQSLVSPGADWARVLERLGMREGLRAHGLFMEAVGRSVLEMAPKLLAMTNAAESWSRLDDFLSKMEERPDRRGQLIARPALRFPNQGGATARALLAPWLAGGPAPHAPQKAIETWLVHQLGDPRLVRSRHWQDAGEAATNLVRSWLARETLEYFFRLIEQSGSDRQWHWRKRFWLACLQKARDPECWVVLGTVLAARVRINRDLAGSFGRLSSEQQQAVLLIRLRSETSARSIVFCEWSHVGKLRAWSVGSAGCPDLYKQSYETHALRGPGLAFPRHPLLGRGDDRDPEGLRHDSADTGLWQGRAAALLSQRLGIELSAADYMR